MSRTLRLLQEIGGRQHGVFSLAEAAGGGAAPSAVRYLARTGVVDRLYPGVFCLPGTTDSWHRRLMTALLVCGPEALASHRAAARLWGLAGAEQEIVEVLIRQGRRPRRLAALVHETDSESLLDRRCVANIPVTRIERTLLDYAGVVKPELAEVAFHDALTRGRTSLTRLAQALERLGRRGRPGTARLRTLLADRVGLGSTLESPLEIRFLRLVRATDLPTPVPQHEILDAAGGFVARVDFAYPDRRLAIELDGYAYHGPRQEWERDLARQNAIFAAQWHLRRFTSRDLDQRRQYVLDTVRAAYASVA